MLRPVRPSIDSRCDGQDPAAGAVAAGRAGKIADTVIDKKHTQSDEGRSIVRFLGRGGYRCRENAPYLGSEIGRWLRFLPCGKRAIDPHHQCAIDRGSRGPRHLIDNPAFWRKADRGGDSVVADRITMDQHIERREADAAKPEKTSCDIERVPAQHWRKRDAADGKTGLGGSPCHARERRLRRSTSVRLAVDGWRRPGIFRLRRQAAAGQDEIHGSPTRSCHPAARDQI